MPPPFLKNIIVLFFLFIGRGCTLVIYMSKLPIKTRVRVRKHTYELISELVYRVELILLGKKKEFGKLQPETTQALSGLLSAARAAKTQLEKNCLQDSDYTSRSRELNNVVATIEALAEAKVLDMAGVKA
jgi:hypothetical protein